MPLVCISLNGGKPEEFRLAVAANVRLALVEAFAVAPTDHIHILTRAEPGTHGPPPGAPRSSPGADAVVIQVTAPDTRSATQKRAFYQRLAELLQDSLGIRPEAVLLHLQDTPRENWFPGHSA